MQPHTEHDAFDNVRRMVLDLLEQTERDAQAQARSIVEQAEGDARDIVDGAHAQARQALAEAAQAIDEIDSQLAQLTEQIEHLRRSLAGFRGQARPLATPPPPGPGAQADAPWLTPSPGRAWDDDRTWGAPPAEPAPLADLEDEGAAFELAETPPAAPGQAFPPQPGGAAPGEPGTGYNSEDSLRALKAALEALNRPRDDSGAGAG